MTDKINYTRGEWKAIKLRESNGYWTIKLKGLSHDIATVWSGHNEVEANAQLIASAPDLYEAAKQVSRESGPDMSPSLGAIDDLREALAKAEN